MRKKKAEEFKVTLMAVQKEMAKPRMATSARGKKRIEPSLKKLEILWVNSIPAEERLFPE